MAVDARGVAACARQLLLKLIRIVLKRYSVVRVHSQSIDITHQLDKHTTKTLLFRSMQVSFCAVVTSFNASGFIYLAIFQDTFPGHFQGIQRHSWTRLIFQDIRGRVGTLRTRYSLSRGSSKHIEQQVANKIWRMEKSMEIFIYI